MTKKLVKRTTTIEEYITDGKEDNDTDASAQAHQDEDDQHGHRGEDEDVSSRRDGMRTTTTTKGGPNTGRIRVRPAG